MSNVQVRGFDTTDIGAVTRIDELITGDYRPEVWEGRTGYYLRRDPEAALVAESDGLVVGFMFGDLRSGEFGLEEPTGWIEVVGVDPAYQGKDIGRTLATHLVDHFRTRGASSVRTLVDESMSELADFFSSLGFSPAPLRPFVKRLNS